MIFVEYPVCVISVAVTVALVKKRLLHLVFAVLYNRRIFISVNCNTEFGVCLQINSVVTKVPGTHCFLNWDSMVLDWDP